MNVETKKAGCANNRPEQTRPQGGIDRQAIKAREAAQQESGAVYASANDFADGFALVLAVFSVFGGKL